MKTRFFTIVLIQYAVHMSLVLMIARAQFKSYCTSSEAKIDGIFMCLSQCDKDHYFDGKHYCLSYFPDNMACPMVPFDREKILTCNGEFENPSSPNHWVILIGGSNAYLEVKNLIDMLLGLDQGTYFNPLSQYDNNLVAHYELASVYDFIWNSSHDVIHKGFFPFQNHTPFYIPGNASSLFLDVPVPASGALRVTYMDTHYVTEFQLFIDLIVAAKSNWLATNPVIDVKFEWTGIWDNGDESQHSGNILYLNSRKNVENINFRSFVMTDSAFDCNGMGYSSQYAIKDAITNTPSTIPVNFWSKRTMAMQQYELTGNCMTDSHAYPGITHVFTNRYFNQICQPHTDMLESVVADEICFHVDPDQSCFQNDYWNFEQVCQYDYKTDFTEVDFTLCKDTTPDVKLPLCKAASATETAAEMKIDTLSFDIFVYVSFVLTSMYVLYTTDELHAVPHMLAVAWEKFSKNLRKQGELCHTDIEVAEVDTTDTSVKGSTDRKNKSTSKTLLKPCEKIIIDDTPENSLNEDSLMSSNNAKADVSDSIEGGILLTHQEYIPDFDSIRIHASATPRFKSLGFARYLASVHITLGHMFQAGHFPSLNGFNKFGFTWVPWFFLLGGFMLSIAEARKKESKQGTIQYVLKRLQNIYPTYFLGIVISIITVGIIKGNEFLPTATDTILYVCLLQSWIPNIVEYGYTYLTQCWFLSCLLFYWTVFFLIRRFLDKLSINQQLSCAGVASVVLPILYHISSAGRDGWYLGHKYLRSSEPVDIAVLVLKYHPLAYLHIFALGCCLPPILQLMRSNYLFHYIAPFISLIAYASMLILFFAGGDDIPGYKLGLRLGVISSLQCLLLLGLCNKEDWLARLFSSPVLRKLGDFSFSQYVFQFLVWGWYEAFTGKSVADTRYFLLLFTTSVIVKTVVEPFNSYKYLQRLFIIASVFLVVYAMLQPVLSAHSRVRYASTYKPPVWFDEFDDISIVFTILGDGRDLPIFNPSFSSMGKIRKINASLVAPSDTRILYAARRGLVSSKWSSWYGEKFIINRWQSQVLLTVDNFPVTIIDTNDFIPCMPEPVCNTNGTIVVKVSDGPEDPRLFVFNGTTYISLFSYDNILTTSNRAFTCSSSYLGFYGTGTHVCKATSDGLIGRMYIAELSQHNSLNKCIATPLIPVYQESLKFEKNSIVKNWLAFSFSEELYFIHQISPRFLIMKTTVMNETYWSTSLASDTKTPDKVRKLDFSLRSEGGISITTKFFFSTSASSSTLSSIHGSANPVLIRASTSHWNEDYYLSVFHTTSNQSDNNYASYFFSFSSHLPFRITGLSKRMPLNLQDYSSLNCGGKDPFGFVSGLEALVCRNASLGICIDVGYGVCDKTSRKMTMSLLDIEMRMMTRL